ncbi:FAD-binding protein [bacterium]|nr:FAD-binding protein [bacterium]
MDHQVIIVGNTIAALNAAITIASKRIPVMIFSRTPLRRSPSLNIKEGINAAMASPHPDISTQVHLYDTVLKGDYLIHQNFASEMIDAAEKIVLQYDRMGVPFNRTEEGYVKLFHSDDATEARIARVDGRTSHFIVNALASQVDRFVKESTITLYENWQFLSLIQDDDGNAVGIVAQNLFTMEIKSFSAHGIVMAAGGFEQIYESKAAPFVNDGAEISALFESGAILANCEFVKFDTEGVHPLGGLWIDESSSTSIPGLFAAGGCQYLFNGAGSLNGNRLLAESYSGLKAGSFALEYFISQGMESNIPTSVFDDSVAKIKAVDEKMLNMNGDENPYLLKKDLNQIMLEYVGSKRNADGLNKAIIQIDELKSRFKNCGIRDKGLWVNQELMFMKNLSSMLNLSQIVTRSALKREESRGCHLRDDFPNRNDEKWLFSTLVRKNDEDIQFNFEEEIDLTSFSSVKDVGEESAVQL